MVGKLVHLSWARAGDVWRVVEIYTDGSVLLETRKTKRRRLDRVENLCYTRGRV